MISSKLLRKTQIVNHAFFNSNNGYSKGIYKSLNCGKGSKDKKEYIKKNLDFVKMKIKSRNNNILTFVSNISAYIILIVAVVLGTASNGFAKGAQGFTLLLPSVITAVTIVGCMYTLSLVMKTIPVGITYASFAGLCIIATTIVGMYKFKQIPDLYTMIGLALIIAGVLIVNLLGKAN